MVGAGSPVGASVSPSIPFPWDEGCGEGLCEPWLPAGQRTLHHRGDVLETLVLLNPSDKSLCDEVRTGGARTRGHGPFGAAGTGVLQDGAWWHPCVPLPSLCPPHPRVPSMPVSSPQLRNLITDVSQHKLLVFAGPCVEDTGELMLQTGCFSLRDFIQIFTDKEVRCWAPPEGSCLFFPHPSSQPWLHPALWGGCVGAHGKGALCLPREGAEAGHPWVPHPS